jgi:hypothetical protein
MNQCHDLKKNNSHQSFVETTTGCNIIEQKLNEGIIIESLNFPPITTYSELQMKEDVTCSLNELC